MLSLHDVRPCVVLLEQVRVQVRELDGVPDRLDLPGEAADLGVVDVRNLFEAELLDLRLRDLLVDVAGPGVEQQRVAGADGLAAQRRSEAHTSELQSLKRTSYDAFRLNTN